MYTGIYQTSIYIYIYIWFFLWESRIRGPYWGRIGSTLESSDGHTKKPIVSSCGDPKTWLWRLPVQVSGRLGLHARVRPWRLRQVWSSTWTGLRPLFLRRLQGVSEWIRDVLLRSRRHVLSYRRTSYSQHCG